MNGSRQLHQIRLVFEDGLPVRNQVQVRRYSCVCETCQNGGECSIEWEVNAWKTVALELKDNQIELFDDDIFEDDLVPL